MADDSATLRDRIEALELASDAAIAMCVLWIANALNIVLDPLLIFGLRPFPKLGVQGAAIATTIGRGTAVLVQVYTLLGPGGTLRVRTPHQRIQPALMAQLVRLFATETQTFIATASWIGLTRVTAIFGAEALAAPCGRPRSSTSSASGSGRSRSPGASSFSGARDDRRVHRDDGIVLDAAGSSRDAAREGALAPPGRPVHGPERGAGSGYAMQPRRFV